MKFICLLLALSVNTHAAKSLGTHVHGVVSIDMAVDNKQLLVMIKGPSQAFLDFEHKAKTPKQKSALLKLEADLGLRVLSTIGMKEIKNCKIIQSEFKQVFHGESHSEIETQNIIECQQALSGKSLSINLQNSYPRIENLKLQLIRNDGTMLKTASKEAVFKLKL